MSLLQDAEKVEVRRFCGYPAYGAAPTGMQSWRYFQIYGLLEFRLNNLADTEIAIIRRYIHTLTTLEVAIPAAANNLDTNQASSWFRNPTELQDRMRLLDEWRRRLCGFLGVAAGPGLANQQPALVV